MLIYHRTVIPEMRQLRASLDALLKKNVPFKWYSECQNTFDKAKEILASPLLLTHYDPKLDLMVAGDASDYGIGAVILHRFADGSEKAISHARGSLTETEKKYGQIENEGLALVYTGQNIEGRDTLCRRRAKEAATEDQMLFRTTPVPLASRRLSFLQTKDHNPSKIP
ncbi:hypothetical protein TELCIR_16882 [Teladorsagia circumcincta]|uniref:Reverse transcriptase/retrotransposon-derived protein RNase H-like domain-containing protein n=1 Tax=Teladorsagia circumcincta TaxID=45464 RepID=A0A2G9TUA3_TELCI|nr:hypothetical protein TELCIR_16882 [Teladorsagia circumcincta]